MRKRAILLVLCMLGPSILGFLKPVNSTSSMYTGHDNTTVIDGDTIQIGDTVFQLSGIDAPELGQVCGRDRDRRHCGLDAAYALNKQVILATPPVACYRVDGDASAVVATCVRGEQDLSLTMIEAGHAVAAPEGSPTYDPAEAPLFRRAEVAAKAAGMGIWSSEFTPPWEWRKQREGPDRAGMADPACVVKGKVTDAGERFYYGPLDEAYDKLTLDPNRGDRLFCSDDQARQAGWLRAGQAMGGAAAGAGR